MKIPSTIRIAGHTYTIVALDDPLNNELGRTKASANLIGLASDQPESQEASTLLHEILHVISFLYQLGFDEPMVRTLESALFQIMRDNHLNFGEDDEPEEAEDEDEGNHP